MRAAGLQGDSSPEIIEILDDDTDAFRDRAPIQALPDDGGRRWVGPTAALALAAIIGYGVVTSTSSGAPKVASVTTVTIVTPTTHPSPTTTAAAGPLLPFYAADPPPQFQVEYVDVRGADQTSSDIGNYQYQLWAAPGPASSTRPWFSVNIYVAQGDLFATNAYRVDTDRGPVAISHAPSGQSLAEFSYFSNSVQVTAFGWTDEDLVKLARSISVSSTQAVFFGEPALIDGYQLFSTVDPWSAVQGTAPEQVFYRSSEDPGGGFFINVSPLNGPMNGDFTLDRQTALQFLINHARPFTVAGHSAVAGALANQGDFAIATWTAGDHIVTVGGQMPVPQLIAIATTVHEVSAAEWEAMKFTAITNSAASNNGNTAVDEPAPVQVSSGTDPNGAPWTIRAALATYGDFRQVNWNWFTNGTSTTPDDTVQINTVVNKDRTYVLADLPRDVAATADLHVSRAGLDPAVVPFSDIDPTLDRTFAAFAFSEPGPYTAEVVGADGTVLATWPSS